MAAPVSQPQNQPVAVDPLENWKLIAKFFIGFTVVYCFYATGSNWCLSVAALLPTFFILNGVSENKVPSIIGGFALLLLSPVFAGFYNLLLRQVCQANTATTPDVFNNMTVCVIFAILYPLCATVIMMISRLSPVLKFPDKVHLMISLITYISGALAMVICSWKFIAWIDQKLKIMGIGSYWLLALFLIAIFALSVYRIIKLVFHPESIVAKPLVAEGANNAASAPGASCQLSERPSIRLSDVAGMQSVKDQIRLRLIEPVKSPELAARYGLQTGGGVLLYGPPGTGKTHIARAVAGELNLPFYMITAADVFGRYVGDSENNIRNIFLEARKNPLSVVFIDELETIFSKRSENLHEVTHKVISVILQELDGVDKNKNPILLLGATNTPWLIDEAFLRPGRFDIMTFVDLPDADARRQMLQSIFKKSPLPVENGFFDYMVENTESYSGADLNGIALKIRQKAFDARVEYYSMQLGYEVLLESPPSANGEILQRIRAWEKQRQI